MSAEQPTHVGNPNNTHPWRNPFQSYLNSSPNLVGMGFAKDVCCWRNPFQSYLNSSPNLVDTNKVQSNVTVSVDIKDHVEHAEKTYKKYGHLACYDNVVADHLSNGTAKLHQNRNAKSRMETMKEASSGLDLFVLSWNYH